MIRPNIASQDSDFCEIISSLARTVRATEATFCDLVCQNTRSTPKQGYKRITNVHHDGERGCSYFGC